MGWTFTHKPNGMTVKEFFQKEYMSCTIHDCKVVNRTTAYMAVSSNKKPEQVFAVVCLLAYRPKDYNFNFGYKDMDETCGPCEATCPISVLDKLTTTDNEYAKKWRERAWENVNRKLLAPKLKKGAVLKLKKEIRFSDGVSRQHFLIKSVRPLRLEATNGTICRITNLKQREYEVLD